MIRAKGPNAHAVRKFLKSKDIHADTWTRCVVRHLCSLVCLWFGGDLRAGSLEVSSLHTPSIRLVSAVCFFSTSSAALCGDYPPTNYLSAKALTVKGFDGLGVQLCLRFLGKWL